MGVFLSDGGDLVVFRSRPIPRVRQPDAGLPAECLLVRVLGVPGTVRHDGEPRFTLHRATIPREVHAVVFNDFISMFSQTVFVFYVINYEPVTYGKHYTYPWWGEGLGVIISLMSMVWIPLYAVYYLITEPGTLRQVGPKRQLHYYTLHTVIMYIAVEWHSRNVLKTHVYEKVPFFFFFLKNVTFR